MGHLPTPATGTLGRLVLRDQKRGGRYSGSVPRPFRFRRPTAPPRCLARPRLLEVMARRWDHRVVTVVAGPGFGKTALLVAAMTHSRPEEGLDIWLSCEPGDRSATHLAGALARVLGLPSGADLDRILDAVWSRAPGKVCLILDDVHEIPAGSDGAALLARLATDLAGNGHLVLASRDGVPVPLARLAAGGQLIRLSEPDLVFDPIELEAFRRRPPCAAPTPGLHRWLASPR